MAETPAEQAFLRWARTPAYKDNARVAFDAGYEAAEAKSRETIDNLKAALQGATNNLAMLTSPDGGMARRMRGIGALTEDVTAEELIRRAKEGT